MMKVITHKRPDWDTYFLRITKLVATRSTCLRRNVGAVLVKDNRILSTGYNGAPEGLVHCLEIGCLRDKLKVPSGTHHELCRGLHAEHDRCRSPAAERRRAQEIPRRPLTVPEPRPGGTGLSATRLVVVAQAF